MSIKDMLAESAGSTSFFNQDTPVGATVTGQIVGTAVRQQTNFQSKEPETWDDGSPKQQIVVTVATNLRDPSNEDDDGTRSVYIKWWGAQRQALSEAIKAANADDILVGGNFSATYMRQDTPTKKGLSGVKHYTFTYQQPSATAGMVTPDPAAPAQPPTPQAAQPIPQQQTAPAAPAPDPQAVLAQAQSLIRAGLTDDQIAGALAAGGNPNFNAAAVMAVRQTMA